MLQICTGSKELGARWTVIEGWGIGESGALGLREGISDFWALYPDNCYDRSPIHGKGNTEEIW